RPDYPLGRGFGQRDAHARGEGVWPVQGRRLAVRRKRLHERDATRRSSGDPSDLGHTPVAAIARGRAKVRWQVPGGSSYMHVTRPISALRAVIAAVLLVGCSSSRPESGPIVDQGQARLYGSDGNMRDGFGDTLKDEPGVLAGMKGTTPLAPLTEDFKKRIRGIDPTVVRDFSYAGDTYDAVVVAALAAEVARTTEPTTTAKY